MHTSWMEVSILFLSPLVLMILYAAFAFSLAIASSNCPEREFAAFNLRFDYSCAKKKSGGKFQKKKSMRGEVYLLTT